MGLIKRQAGFMSDVKKHNRHILKLRKRSQRARPVAEFPSRIMQPAEETGLDLIRLLVRQLLPLGFAVAIVALLWDRIAGLDYAYIQASLVTVQPHQWVGAALLSAISFWAVGRYDRVVHRLIGTPIASREAQISGATAIALSQTVGFGVISSAFVRWRMLPELTLLRAMHISMMVALSFLSAWAVVTAVFLLLIPVELAGIHWIRPLGWGAFGGAGLLMTLSLWRPALLSRFNIPPLRAMAAFVALAALDTMAAGAALWVILPENCTIGILPLMAAYLVALGAGLISGTPGGVGPFELTLLALLPHLEQEPVLAGILAFRAVYYAIPALIAAVVTVRGPRKAARRDSDTPQSARITPIARAPQLPAHLHHQVANAPRAETALLRHGNLAAVECAGETAGPVSTGMGKLSGQSLILLSDPLTPVSITKDYLRQAHCLAQEKYRAPFLYKIGPRFAALARKNGWKTLPIAREAWLNPQIFTTAGAERRQLRRKLRQAEKAGLRVQLGGGNLPIADMNDIAEAWSTDRGDQRGFSMGVWSPATLPYAQVFLAYQNNQLVGFITLHKNAQEQVLDLMRMGAKAPDGTMHLLLVAAIRQAASEGYDRLSLAAVPYEKQSTEPKVFHWLRERLDRITGAAGLRQFKTCFAPNWETLYAAAPKRCDLVMGALDVMREISRPR
ncbi:phosphatidylglycerol lysyltransferase [Aliiroseovarius crassostreae]|nr:phosphatidylglycerol lysyltransferase [Aliiroseovarius crassostreae]